MFHCLIFTLLFNVNRNIAFIFGAVPVLIEAGLWGLWGGAVAGLTIAFVDIIIVPSTENEIRHGRTASYPAAPAQISASGTTALSSSTVLASA